MKLKINRQQISRNHLNLCKANNTLLHDNGQPRNGFLEILEK